jgi:NTE family protein
MAAVVFCLLAATTLSAQDDGTARPIVGVALGGGSAKGFAHVGVLRWFEAHHIPIDRIAGASMGGLIGGAYASGMSSTELETLIRETDWTEVFGSSTYRFVDVARKEDMRAYPSRLEFHLKGGLGLPPALDRGQQVELLLHRVAGLYPDLSNFDDLPTPFRCVAVDLRTASLIVLDEGSLPTAMRATMSIPGIFPPVRLGDQVLVDGGALNNVPADVARAMGADVVIAVRVGPVVDTAQAETTLLGIADQTVSAMMRASTRRAMDHADLVIHAATEGFTGGDWGRAAELIEDGYRAAEGMKDQLLPHAVDEATWRHYVERRAAKRRTGAPVISQIIVRGAAPADEPLIRRRFQGHVGQPLNVPRLESDITRLGGIDRYTSFGWAVVPAPGGKALLIEAHPTPTAPPFLMTSVNIQNRTSDEATFQLGLRYLGYDLVGRGSELRVDLELGTDRGIAAELRRRIAPSPIFLALSAAARSGRIDWARSDAVVAQYREQRAFGQLDLGWRISHDAETRLGIRGGYYRGSVEVGDPRVPDASGPFSESRLRAIYDNQNNAVVPSRGVRLVGTGRYVLDSPEPEVVGLVRSNRGLTQAEITASEFWSWSGTRRRVFAVVGAGTSFDDDPLPTDQFTLGRPMHLDAFAPGELRGDHYATLTVGYLHTLGRLPEFLGGPALSGIWIENGSAFNETSDLDHHLQVGLGVIAETLLGPGWITYSFGGSASRLHVGIGRFFVWSTR